jgi:hypothetical protein
MMKKGLDDSDDDNDDDDEEEAEESWGKKHSNYYNGDTADLEIGQDMADAEDEAEAAMELHRGKLARMTEEDFADDLGASSASDSESEQNIGSKLNGKTAAKAGRSAKKALKRGASAETQGLGELELVALGNSHNAANVQIEHISRDLSKLSKDQRLELVSGVAHTGCYVF